MGRQLVAGLFASLLASAGVLSCTSQPLATGVVPATPASQTGAPTAARGARLDLETWTAPARLGATGEGELRLSHERHLSNPQPWQNRAGAEPFRLFRPEKRDLETARLERRAGRSFEGAPPVMGHSLAFSGDRDCLECHGNGMTIGKRIARVMSHVELPNCTQCHIEGANEFLDQQSLPENEFVGWWKQERGATAMRGAPPTIPHGTFLRTTCLSCHGQYGYEGLRTNHPERANCLQCHIAGK